VSVADFTSLDTLEQQCWNTDATKCTTLKHQIFIMKYKLVYKRVQWCVSVLVSVLQIIIKKSNFYFIYNAHDVI
jgi:hypothetical protein